MKAGKKGVWKAIVMVLGVTRDEREGTELEKQQE